MLNEHAALLFSESVISQPLFCSVVYFASAGSSDVQCGQRVASSAIS